MESLGDILKRIIDCGPNPNGDRLPEALPPVETCAICRGGGWVSKRVPLGHPDFGEAFPCRCQFSQRQASLVRYANLPHPDAPRTFENFKPAPGAEEALAAAGEFAQGDTPHHVLTLAGRNGSGKTHLGEAIGRVMFDRGVLVKFEYTPALLDRLRNSYDPDSEVSHERVYARYSGAEVLILDDFPGEQKVTSWALGILGQLVDERYRLGKKLVVTTDLTLDTMAERLGPRIASRLFDFGSGDVRAVTITAKCYRTGRAWFTPPWKR